MFKCNFITITLGVMLCAVVMDVGSVKTVKIKYLPPVYTNGWTEVPYKQLSLGWKVEAEPEPEPEPVKPKAKAYSYSYYKGWSGPTIPVYKYSPIIPHGWGEPLPLHPIYHDGFSHAYGHGGFPHAYGHGGGWGFPGHGYGYGW